MVPLCLPLTYLSGESDPAHGVKVRMGQHKEEMPDNNSKCGEPCLLVVEKLRRGHDPAGQKAQGFRGKPQDETPAAITTVPHTSVQYSAFCV